KGDGAPGGETGFVERGAGETVEFSACEMAEGVAGKRIQREHDDVDAHDQSAEADSEMAIEIVGERGVVPEKSKEHEREVEEIPVKILEDKRKSRFALVAAFGRFTDGASGRIEKKRAIVGFAVVVAGCAKTKRSSQDEQRGRELPPMMMGIDKRRIKRRKIRPPIEIRVLESAQRGVNAKAAEQNNYRQEFDPPSVATQRASKPRFGQEGWRASHLRTSRVAVSKSKTTGLQTDYIQDAGEGLIQRMVSISASRETWVTGMPLLENWTPSASEKWKKRLMW